MPIVLTRRLLLSNIVMNATLKHHLILYSSAGVPVHSRRFLHLQTFLRLRYRKSTSARAGFSIRSSYRFCSLVPATSASGAVELEQKEVVEEDEVLRGRLARLGVLLEGQGITFGSKVGQYTHILCPKCRGGQSGERSLSLFVREDGGLAMWSCFRGKCGWKGHYEISSEGKVYNSFTQIPKKTSKQVGISKNYRVITEGDLKLEALCEQIKAYFFERGISYETLHRNAVMQRDYGDKIAIAFTYRREGRLVNCKYRDIEKRFWQEKDAEKILYGLDDIVQAKEIIIVEGEIDKLSMEEAGYRNCVSVPDGAPAKVSDKDLPNEEQDTKYEYLWNCKEHLEKVSRIILATDSDPPGQALAEELARRLGKERCWRVIWPKRKDEQTCKDANEVLMYLGPDALKQALESAEFYPVRGLFNFSNYFQDIDAYYHHRYGYELGISTGWCSVDEFYKVVPGELTIITGVPNSGKSEWIDALLCNINRKQGWKFALCSMENEVREHARKLLEKHIKKPFFNASYGASVERMTSEELQRGKVWLKDTFHLIRCSDDCLPSVDWVIKLAKIAVLRHGVRGLVIDPYNELDHQRKSNQTETEYVSQMLTKIKRFAQHHACHVWFVAHPKQLQNWNGGPSNMYDVSGSAHFINKCDNGIVVHRNRDKELGPLDRVQICVRKVRNKVIGGVGDAFLSYNRVTGEYEDFTEEKPPRQINPLLNIFTSDKNLFQHVGLIPKLEEQKLELFNNGRVSYLFTPF